MIPLTRFVCPEHHQLWARELPDGNWFPLQQSFSEVSWTGPAVWNDITITPDPTLSPWRWHEVQCRSYEDDSFYGESLGPIGLPEPAVLPSLLIGLALLSWLRRQKRGRGHSRLQA